MTRPREPEYSLAVVSSRAPASREATNRPSLPFFFLPSASVFLSSLHHAHIRRRHTEQLLASNRTILDTLAASNRAKKGHAQALGGNGRKSNHRKAYALMDLSGMDGGEYSDKENIEDLTPLFKPLAEPVAKKRNAASPLKEKMQPAAKKAMMGPRPKTSPVKKQPPKMGSLLPKPKMEQAGKEPPKPEPVKEEQSTSKPINKAAVATASEAESTTKTIITNRPLPSNEELHIRAELQKQSKPPVLHRILNNSTQRREEIKTRIEDLKAQKAAIGPGAEKTDIMHEINALNVEGRLVLSLSCLAQLRLREVEDLEKGVAEAGQADG
ncbi:hypothetical protein M409DRAFT_61294 [Zasmidium cellare ATCC 36951]|uniref:Uncharacterized protein n=1 Tax=Zasmidium cellare ATCC 36951 TaxID=1080233 RepID=A0A6A6BWB2_ZASCE|nr:uncharacterized protein M409DRAFT_61294 [Zasmidium cellare ATCC 36951]KAF2158873.1 hypothetical protein M409DRAFT_61294 [Zasmidium cellare ATCC 36951]